MRSTRAAILDGAQTSILRHGTRRTTMLEVAAVSSVAKATLYNHFRTKSDVLAALGRSTVETLLAGLADGPTPAAALERLGLAVGAHPLVRHLAATEPAVLAELLGRPQPATEESWTAARAALRAALADVQDGDEVAELALRWVVQQVFWPCSPELAHRAVVGMVPSPDPR